MTIQPSSAPLVLAITPRALFDLRDTSQSHGPQPLRPGRAFHLVRKLLALNTSEQQRVEMVLVSPDCAETGLQILDAIDRHGLPIARAAFTRGAPGHHHAAAFGAQLFLSTDAGDVRLALEHGIAAATLSEGAAGECNDDVVRIAFDGDAVLFSDEAEQVYAHAGLDAFVRSERAARHLPLAAGPFQPLLLHLHRLQALYPRDACPIRTALVTARGVPAHARALRTLRAWQVEVDEALFLAGMDKGPFLRGFGADIFFDDQHRNCHRASAYVACAHVPYGIRNRPVRPALQLAA